MESDEGMSSVNDCFRAGGMQRLRGCRRIGASVLLAALVAPLAGCATPDLCTADRLRQGLVLVLPGIEGPSFLNAALVRGLEEGGVPSALEVYDWGTGSPFGFLIHLTAAGRNQRQAEAIAARIRRYKSLFPDRPVHLIGHSGGAGVALLALEALPREPIVTSAHLLAAAVSPTYDLRAALSRTEYGIWSFYSSRDVGFLGVGTTVLGGIDRAHRPSAGAVGFQLPEGINKPGRELYRRKLHQVPYSSTMARSGNKGGHIGWASRRFARDWIAPMILADMEAGPVRALRPQRSSLAAARIESRSGSKHRNHERQ